MDQGEGFQQATTSTTTNTSVCCSSSDPNLEDNVLGQVVVFKSLED